MVRVCWDRLGGSLRRVQKREEVRMPVAKRFLHLCLCNWSIEPGTGACICIVVYLGVKDRGYFMFRFPVNDDQRVGGTCWFMWVFNMVVVSRW